MPSLPKQNKNVAAVLEELEENVLLNRKKEKKKKEKVFSSLFARSPLIRHVLISLRYL